MFGIGTIGVIITMGRLVDIDAVLGIGCLSGRARNKIAQLKSHPAISYEATRIWDELHRDGTESHCLGAMMLCAFRYAVDRHGTQCLMRCDMNEIILANLNLMCDDFIRQMICDIHREFRLYQFFTSQDETGNFHMDDPSYLEPFLEKLQAEYVKRGHQRIPRESEC